MLTPLKDNYLVSANEEENGKTASGLLIDTTWDRYSHAVQNGIIRAVPQQLSVAYSDKTPINIGDKVYLHHFVIQDDNYIMDGEEKLFKLPRFHLFCKIEDGKIVAIDDWVFASPILETEESITKTFGTLKLWTKAAPDKVHLMATAEHVSKHGLEQGIKPGDTIMFKKDADYEIKVEGKTYYRMKLQNIVSVIRDGKLLPLRDEILVANNVKNEEVRASGLIIPILKPQKEQKETILAIGIQDEEGEFKVGDDIMYINHTGSKIEYEEKKYIILRPAEAVGKFL